MDIGDRNAIGFDAMVSKNKEWFNDLPRKRSTGPVSRSHRVLDRAVSQNTLAVHAGTYSDPVTGSVGTPIFQTSTFLLNDSSYRAFSDGALRDVPIYTRYGNPSQWAVQEKIAALEGAQSALVTSSGMSAITSTIFGLTNAGSHIISAYDVYGGTYNLLREDMPSAGREVTFVDPEDLDSIRRAIRPETSMLFFESLTNPLLKAPDIEAIAAIAKGANALLVIDNTFLSPINHNPLLLGADIVIHSATKYLAGHSDLTAGAVAGKRKFLDKIWAQALRFGGMLEPLSCFLLERGIKTLALRMKAHNANSEVVAKALVGHRAVSHVYHPSLSGPSTQAALSKSRGSGGMVSFVVAAGDAAALRFMDSLEIPHVATSLGGVESLVSMPYNTSHSSLSVSQRKAAGIKPGLVRLSVGIEDSGDIVGDLFQALDRSMNEAAE